MQNNTFASWSRIQFFQRNKFNFCTTVLGSKDYCYLPAYAYTRITYTLYVKHLIRLPFAILFTTYNDFTILESKSIQRTFEWQIIISINAWLIYRRNFGYRRIKKQKWGNQTYNVTYYYVNYLFRNFFHYKFSIETRWFFVLTKSNVLNPLTVFRFFKTCTRQTIEVLILVFFFRTTSEIDTELKAESRFWHNSEICLLQRQK